MGEINKTNRLFNTITEVKQDMNYSDYSKNLESRPVLTTWYNQDLVESTADSGLQDVHQYIGSHSPVQYNKIEQVPLYNVPTTNIGLNFDDKGPHIEFEFEGVLPPGIFEPKPNDFVLINHLSGEYLFKVKNVDVDTIRSNNYYKVSMYFSKNNDGSIEKSVSRTSVVLYDEIGSKSNKCIMLSKDYAECEKLTELSVDIVKYVKDKYWDNNLCFFMYNENVYDPWVNEFCRVNKLLKNAEYDNVLTIQMPIVADSKNFNVLFNNSYFNGLKSRNKSIITSNKYVMLKNVIQTMGNIFAMNYKGVYGPKTYEVSFMTIDSNLEETFNIEDFNTFKDRDDVLFFKLSRYIDKDFYEGIMNNKLYENPTPIEDVKNTIITYMNSDSIEDCVNLQTIFNKYVNSLDLNPTYTNFISIFSFLFVVREKIDSFKKKKNII